MPKTNEGQPMLMFETAMAVINDRIEHLFEDTVEAMQFLNDYGYVDKLTFEQRKILEDLVESGIVQTDEWHI